MRNINIFGFEIKRRKNIRNETISLSNPRLLDILNIDESEFKNPKFFGQSAYYICLKTLSDKMSSIPCGVYSSSDGITSKFENHYLNKILQLKPNYYQNANTFWSNVETDRNHWGNSFVYIETQKKGRNSGKVINLWKLPAEEIQIYIDDDGIFGKDNALWYVWLDSRSGKQWKFRNEEIMHFKSWLTDKDGIVGKSVKSILESYVDTGQQSNYFFNKQVKSGFMNSKILVYYTADIDDKAKAALSRNIESYSTSSSGKIIPLPHGLTAQNLESKLVDNQFFDLYKFNDISIAAAFGIPPSYLNNYDKGNYANVEMQQESLYKDTLIPILSQYESEMALKLFTSSEIDNGFYLNYNADILLRMNLVSRANAYNTLISSGVYTINEARNKENLQSVNGGDNILVQGANTTLDNVISGINYGKGGEKDGETDKI